MTDWIACYRDAELGTLVDAMKVEEPVTVLCGPRHDQPVKAPAGSWVTLDPGHGYEVLTGTVFEESYVLGDEGDRLELCTLMRYGGRLRCKALAS